MLFGGSRVGDFTQAAGQVMRYRHHASDRPARPSEDSSRAAA